MADDDKKTSSRDSSRDSTRNGSSKSSSSTSSSQSSSSKSSSEKSSSEKSSSSGKTKYEVAEGHGIFVEENDRSVKKKGGDTVELTKEEAKKYPKGTLLPYHGDDNDDDDEGLPEGVQSPENPADTEKGRND